MCVWQQVREAGHHSEECSEDQARVGEVDEGGGGALQKWAPKPQRVCGNGALQETEAENLLHPTSSGNPQQPL